MLKHLKEIWLKQIDDGQKGTEPDTLVEEQLLPSGKIGRFVTRTEGFKKELSALERTVTTYVGRLTFCWLTGGLQFVNIFF